MKNTDIRLVPLAADDADALLAFERANRGYFERSVPGRGDAYYERDGFAARHAALLNEQAEGGSRFYLVKDGEGTIMGRANLNDVDPAACCAEAGYRIGERFSGRGLAKRALTLLIAEASAAGLERLTAKTTLSNPASRRVLESCGFEQTSVEETPYELNGQPVVFAHYTLELERS
ncbi:GNAT family N-acetyltransferase [Saccharibacillus alkalitolerans]|uniref:GNAT family N-acetyltransferase n=1 Tax=Saccharibacillus alkalitolerans TaxID=2705290 RepID=A0ABX0F5B2_9BACL|nr:GNAT family N-acetyltransferase [Saccharibacillus alkalitolerans]NGZ75204.1 GNAT family N-acetyltransferase [Saccharibacillus alkalitolerans]